MGKRKEKSLPSKFETFTLTPIQQTAIEQYRNSKFRYFLLGLGTGLGKTFTAWTIAKEHENVVVVCPAMVRDQWKELYDNVFSYEELDKTNGRKRKPFEQLENYFLILDEVHELKRYNRNSTDFILRNKHKAVGILGLSGTPRFINYEGLFTQLEMCDLSKPYNTKQRMKKALYDEYVVQEYSEKDRRTIIREYKNVEKLNAIYKSISYLNFSTPTEHVQHWIKIPRSREITNRIKDFKKTCIYNGEPYTTVSAQQPLNELLSHGWDLDEIFDDKVYNLLQDLYKEHKKIVVVYRWDATLSVLYDKFENVYIQNGTYKEYKEFDNCETGILFAQEGSYKQGLNLPNTEHQVFLDIPSNFEMDTQLRGRISRVDSTAKQSKYYYIYHQVKKKNELEEQQKLHLEDLKVSNTNKL